MQQTTGTELMPLIHKGDEILVDARLLHQMLNVGTLFKDWIVRKINEYKFEENKDFYRAKAAAQNSSRRGGAGLNKLEYSLTLDMAKELAMLQQNETGRMFRRYFIQKEKEARGLSVFLAAPTEVFKGLPQTKINGTTLYQFVPLMRQLGYSTRSSATNRREYYPNHFMTIGHNVYVSESYAQHLFKSSLIIKSRKQVKTAQPLLGPDFGQPVLALK